jgi:hypothetical protein
VNNWNRLQTTLNSGNNRDLRSLPCLHPTLG